MAHNVFLATLMLGTSVLAGHAPPLGAQATSGGRHIPVPPPLPGVAESYADVPGARLFYIDAGGNGIPVIFLHAGTGSARVWEYQIDAFAAAGYRFIAYDRRGYGRTTVTPGGPVGTAADDLEALVAHLGIGRFHLVGTAAGGGVALDYALAYPHRLRTLTVANSVGNVTDSSYRATLSRMLPKEFSALPPDVRELGPSYRAANADGTRRWLDLEHFSRAPGARPPSQPARNRITFATPPALLRLFVPRIRGSESLIVPEAGHSTYWEQPEVFNAAVIAFLKRY